MLAHCGGGANIFAFRRSKHFYTKEGGTNISVRGGGGYNDVDEEMEESTPQELEFLGTHRGLKFYYLIMLINVIMLQSQCSQKVLI